MEAKESPEVIHISEEDPIIRIEPTVSHPQQRAVVLPRVISNPQSDIPVNSTTEVMMMCSQPHFLPSLGSSSSAAPWISSAHGPTTFFKQSQFWNANTAAPPCGWWPQPFTAYAAPPTSAPYCRMFHAIGPPTWLAPMLPPPMLNPGFSPFVNSYPLLMPKGGEPRIFPAQISAPRAGNWMVATSCSNVIQGGIPAKESSTSHTSMIFKKVEEIQCTDPKAEKKGKARRKETRNQYWTQKKMSRKRNSAGGQEGTTSSYEEEEEGVFGDEETERESVDASLEEEGDTEILREAQRLLASRQRKPGRPPKKRPRSPSLTPKNGRKKRKKVEDRNAVFRWNERDDFEWHSLRRETRAFRKQKLEAKMKEALKKSAEEMEEDDAVLHYNKRMTDDEAGAAEMTPISPTRAPSRCSFYDEDDKASRSCDSEDEKEEVKVTGKEVPKTPGEEQWPSGSFTSKAGPTTSTPTRHREWTHFPPARRLLCMDSSPVLPDVQNEWRIDRLRDLLGRKLSTLIDDAKMSPPEDVSCTNGEQVPTEPIPDWLDDDVIASFP